MAVTTTLKTFGFSDLHRRLQTLSVDVRTKVGRAAAAAGAEQIRKEASSRAPFGSKSHKLRGERVEPGNLRKNIVKRRDKDQPETVHAYDVVWSGKAYYGQFVELGTVKDSPQPFLRPALPAAAGRAVAKAADVLAERLDKAGA